jgi:hypothetical protein
MTATATAVSNLESFREAAANHIRDVEGANAKARQDIEKILQPVRQAAAQAKDASADLMKRVSAMIRVRAVLAEKNLLAASLQACFEARDKAVRKVDGAFNARHSDLSPWLQLDIDHLEVALLPEIMKVAKLSSSASLHQLQHGQEFDVPGIAEYRETLAALNTDAKRTALLEDADDALRTLGIDITDLRV